jgi:hypothetical protein
VLVLVPVPPPVRVRVRVLLELARAAGWMAENTVIAWTSLWLVLATLRSGREALAHGMGNSWQSLPAIRRRGGLEPSKGPAPEHADAIRGRLETYGEVVESVNVSVLA